MGNWFHQQWQLAEEGGSDFIPLFFPWFRHPAYKLTTTLTIKSELSPEERELSRVGASMESIAWRRWAIGNKVDDDVMFMQEYPSTAEEAFITSGRPIFDQISLRKCYKPKPDAARGRLVDNGGTVRFVRDIQGPLTIYAAPKRSDTRNDRYFVAADPSETVAGDPACIQVINRQTFEQVAVWHGRINPIHLAYEMERIGRFYNMAMLCPEVEGGGQATIATLIERGYPNLWRHRTADRLPNLGAFTAFGWATNYQRKRWAVGQLQRLIIDGTFTLHDRVTFNQLQNYVEHNDGYWGNNDPDIHDDSVMALAICVTASIAEGPFMADRQEGNIIYDIFKQYRDEENSA
jgi:hypothetical protein